MLTISKSLSDYSIVFVFLPNKKRAITQPIYFSILRTIYKSIYTLQRENVNFLLGAK